MALKLNATEVKIDRVARIVAYQSSDLEISGSKTGCDKLSLHAMHRE